MGPQSSLPSDLNRTPHTIFTIHERLIRPRLDDLAREIKKYILQKVLKDLLFFFFFFHMASFASLPLF